MTDSRTVRMADRLPEAALLTALVAVPLFLVVFTDRVFEPEKAALLRFLALIATAALIAGRPSRLAPASAETPAAPSSERPGWRSRALRAARRRDPIALSLALLWLSEALSSLLSVAPATSLMGSEARGQGLATTSALAVMALCAARLASRPGGLRRLAAFAGAASGPAALYAVLQSQGLDPLPWEGDVVTRVSGPAGSSVMLAGHLVLALPLVAWRVGHAWREARQAPAFDGPLPSLAALGLGAWLLTLALGLWALVASGSRGPALGLAAGLLALGLARSRGRPRRLAATIGAGLALVALVLALNFGPPSLDPLRRMPLLDRVAFALDPERSTTRVRLRLWEGSRAALAEAGPRWAVGYGPETMDLVWAPYYPPILAYDEPRGWLPDRAHNLVLDRLLVGGLLGLLGTTLLYALLLRRCLAWMGLPAAARATGRAPEARGYAAAAMVALVAQLVELQVGFAVTVTRLLLWTLAGALVGLGRPRSEASDLARRGGSDGEGHPRTPTSTPAAHPMADAGLAALSSGSTLAFALARPGLVGGGLPVAGLLVLGSSLLSGLAVAGASFGDARRARDARPPGAPAPETWPRATLTWLLLLTAQALLLGGLALRAEAQPGQGLPWALAGLGLQLCSLIALLFWHAGWHREPRSRTDGHRLAPAIALSLALALLLGTGSVLAPPVAGALSKEGRRLWQAPAAELRAAGQGGRAESYLHRALQRYALAARLAPWEPAYALATARAQVELGDLLRQRAAGQDEPATGMTLRRAATAFAEADRAIATAERRSGPSPLPTLTRARALRVQGMGGAYGRVDGRRLDEAQAAYAEAARLAPGWPEVLDEASATALARGQAARALELARAALALDPFYRRAWRSAAEAWRELGDRPAEIEAYARYFEDYRNLSDRAARSAELQALLATGRSGEALASARELRRLAPQDAFARADLAVLLEAAGADQEALREARAAARLAPQDPGIAALVRRLASEGAERP